MEFLKSASLIINAKTLIVTIIAILATWFCLEYHYFADFPLTLVGIAVVFPVVFSINSAYTRRERGLRSYAECKGFILGFYRTAMDNMDEGTEEVNEVKSRYRQKIIDLFSDMKSFFESEVSEAREREIKIYKDIKGLSKEVQQLRNNGLAGRFASRLSQYLTRSVAAFEDMKTIFYYRTPKGIRAYSKIFIYAFPILYAPYFAFLSQKYAEELPLVFYYVMPILYSFILVSLANIQDHLEQPYDQIGEDDIILDIQEIDDMLQE